MSSPVDVGLQPRRVFSGSISLSAGGLRCSGSVMCREPESVAAPLDYAEAVIGKIFKPQRIGKGSPNIKPCHPVGSGLMVPRELEQHLVQDRLDDFLGFVKLLMRGRVLAEDSGRAENGVFKHVAAIEGKRVRIG